MLRASVLATAVQILRKERLKLSQEKFTELLFGEGADAGYVSRWERGVCAPSRTHRARLAALARKSGWSDLVAAFEDTDDKWRAFYLSELDRQRLALFEIVLLNQPFPGSQDFGFRVPRREYAGLLRALRAVVSAMKRDVARSGTSVWMLTDEQVAAWQREAQRKVGKGARFVEPLSRERVVAWINASRLTFIDWSVVHSMAAQRRADREDRDGRPQGKEAKSTRRR